MAVYHQIDQRSREWFLLRLGKPTASEFHRIVTPGGSLSKQADDYAHRLLAELMLGRPLGDDLGTGYMERGQELEESAISAYEFARDVETDPGGYVSNDAGTFGCSPDRLVGADGLIEIKCPAANTHIGYLLARSAEKEKRPQAQGQLLVTGRKWVDLVSYHPELPPMVVRIERDEKYIELLGTVLEEFAARLAAMRADLEQRFGPFPTPTVPQDAGESMDIDDGDVDAMLARGVCVPMDA